MKEHRDANGALTGYTVTEGGKTYEITFDETSGKAVGDLSGLGPDQICDLLGRDKAITLKTARSSTRTATN